MGTRRRRGCILMREIYVADTETRAYTEARPYLLQYWELWNRYTQFTRGGKLPDSDDFWRRQAPMLHAMSFDQIVANDMVILGGPERVADTILRLASRLDLMGLAMIFKLGAMPYDTVERSMSLFGEELVPRIRQVLTRAVTVDREAAEPSRSIQRAASCSPPGIVPGPIASTARPAR
jgi:alkanesulfonate monooxygenase SsuD/methylene tetrahydromethanopterin reductase-like flavin-dependent oxidoreductase (luciferase family)